MSRPALPAGRRDLERQALARKEEHLSHAARLALDAMRLGVVHDNARDALARMDTRTDPRVDDRA